MRIAWMILVMLAGAAQGAHGGEAERLRVFVGIVPQAYFAERIGGERVQVEVLVGAGKSPHTFEATPGQMAALARAQVYLGAGQPFEERLLEKVKAINIDMRVVDVSRGITRRSAGEGETHLHEDEKHTGEGDPHFWLAPKNAAVMAANIAEALAKADGENAQVYKRNLGEVEKELRELDERTGKALEPYRGRSFYVFHPAFGYLADAYGLRQVSVEKEGKTPGARGLAEVIAKARADGAKVIFAQPQFSTRSAETVARAVGARVAVMDPLGSDYIKTIEDMTVKLSESFREADGQEAHDE